MNGERNVLVFRTGQLGDTIVSLPAIRAIRAQYPDHRLVLLIPQQPGNLVSPFEILGGAKIFDQVLLYIPPSASHITWFHQLALAAKIRRLKPEAFFYLRDFPYKHVRRDKLFFQVVCGVRNSYGLNGSRYIFDRRDASGRLLRYPSEAERLLDIVREARANLQMQADMDFTLPISERECFQIESLWRENEIRPNEWIFGFGPGSKMAAKRWPLDRFIEVARTLLRDLTRARVMIFGGPEDFPLGEEMKRVLGELVVNVAGQLTVLESAEALRRCCLYIGNDTGVMHLAAAVGTPCVAIFSARDHPGRWEPYGANHIVLRKDPDCAGCLLQVCTERKMMCLHEIKVNEVLEAVQRILKGKLMAEGQLG
jgi:heptosyltransferase-3